MCGVCGIFAYRDSAPRPDLAELRRTRDHMQRRGPDGSGEWASADGRTLLGHRRLAIIDLNERAAQPMQSADGQLAVTFNGEIYNHVELRHELEALGHVFRTTSDTEVLLHLYADRGEKMFDALRGMYAFALWDEKRKGVLLARDPYGIKPLFYADDGSTLRFASQVRALQAGGGISNRVDPAGLVGFYLWGSVPEPFSIREAVRVVPAGSSLWVDGNGAREPRVHFSLARCWSEASAHPLQLGETGAQERAREALRDSIKHHLVADVPIGAFLSGGVDSGALAALMSEQGGNKLSAITLSFAEFRGSDDDEAPLAAAVAARYGLRHHARRVSQDEFSRDLQGIFDAMDQPTIDGVNSWFVSKATAELGLKVAISGLGGDELFGGYAAFREVPMFVRSMALPARVPLLGKLMRTALGPFTSRVPGLHPKLAGLVEYGDSYAGAYRLKRGLFMPWELRQVLPPELVADGLRKLDPPGRLAALLDPEPSTEFGKLAVLEAAQYMRNQLLRDTDWASMAHSLEVRVPLVDHRLLETLAPLLLGSGVGDHKRVLANAPKRPLPSSICQRAKTGFSTPVQTWMQESRELGSWRRSPLLMRQHCPWARRLAYSIAD
ncbi:MAG TPA: asparagine synthase (glutamine-hydrolyzing), partial [Polyangiales bacterium]|nr:asparagine synthase (glutamine-hydrolyzing) [Polyangiales bacterium]